MDAAPAARSHAAPVRVSHVPSPRRPNAAVRLAGKRGLGGGSTGGAEGSHVHACRTMLDQLVFVPYGETRNKDPVRIQYMRDLMGFCRETLLPNVAVYEQTKGGLPKHLQEVLLPRSFPCRTPPPRPREEACRVMSSHAGFACWQRAA